MGLFEFFFPKKQRQQPVEGYWQTLNAYTPAFTTWQGAIYERELVRSCIEARANHMSKMRVELVGSAHPKLKTKMQHQPNPVNTWSQTLRRMTTILDNYNTVIIAPQIDQYGDIIGIMPVLPSQCTLVEHHGEPFCKMTFGNGKSASVELSKVGIATKFQLKDDYFGESNAALNNTMDLMDIQDQGIQEGVKSSATYRFMAQLGNFALDEDIAKQQEMFSKSNLRRGGGLLLFPNTFTNIKQIDSKPFIVDAEQMKMIKTNCFNYFGVNEKILQNTATPEELDAFYSGALEPMAIQYSEVLSKMLYTLEEQSRGSKVLVTANRLQYMSTSDKISIVKEMGDRGMLTIDEGRELLNYAPLPDGKGQMAPIRGEYYNAAAGEESADA